MSSSGIYVKSLLMFLGLSLFLVAMFCVGEIAKIPQEKVGVCEVHEVCEEVTHESRLTMHDSDAVIYSLNNSNNQEVYVTTKYEMGTLPTTREVVVACKCGALSQ